MILLWENRWFDFESGNRQKYLTDFIEQNFYPLNSLPLNHLRSESQNDTITAISPLASFENWFTKLVE